MSREDTNRVETDEDKGVDLEPSRDETDDEEDIVHEQETEQRVSRLEQAQGIAQLEKRLLADPDIQAVIAAKRAGKKVVVTEAEEEETKRVPLEIDLSELEDDDPAKDLATKLLGKVSESMDSRLGPIEEQMAALNKIAKGYQQREINDQVSRAEKAFPDFRDYRAKMLALVEEFPGMAPEELYVIAKQRAGKLKIEQASTYSERPSSQPRRVAKKQPTDGAIGRKGLKEAMMRALDNNYADMESLE